MTETGGSVNSSQSAMADDTTLLPCPFCGGTEIYIGPMDHQGAWEYWTVGCNNYDCPLDADSVKVEGGTLEKAAAAWNTRATDANLAALQAENERLRAEVDEWKAQHSRDSAELRRLCQHRDEYKARAERLAEALRWIASDDTAKGCDDGMQEVEAIKQRAHAALTKEDRND